MHRRGKVHLPREDQKDTHNNYPSSGAEAFQEVQPRRRLNLVLAPLMPGSFITIILLTPTPLTPTRDPTSTSRPTGKPAITRVRSGTQPSSLSHRIANWLMRTLCHSRQCTRPHITGITGIRTPSTTPTRTDRMTFVYLTRRHAQMPQPTTPAEASAAKSTRENELRSSSPSPSPSPSCSSLDHNNTASPGGQGQGQGQWQGYSGFQTTATACDTPSKDEFVRVAGWLWGVLDRTERLLREMDAMEERGGLASDLGVGVGTD
jgi:hypothetical protein